MAGRPHLHLLPPPVAAGEADDVRDVTGADAVAVAVTDGDVEAGREIALRQLGARARTRRELAGVLARKGVAAAVIDIVLDRLEAVGLVDDAAFAQEYVARRGATKGPAVLAAELRAKGVDPQVAAAAAAAAPDPQEAAGRVIAKKWPQLRSLSPEVAHRRAAGLLQRRGFDPSAAAGILAALRGGGAHP